MDRRLHAVQDRLVERCTQTFKTVQDSMSAMTSVDLNDQIFDLMNVVVFSI
jgi:hypothetical protein